MFVLRTKTIWQWTRCQFLCQCYSSWFLHATLEERPRTTITKTNSPAGIPQVQLSNSLLRGPETASLVAKKTCVKQGGHQRDNIISWYDMIKQYYSDSILNVYDTGNTCGLATCNLQPQSFQENNHRIAQWSTCCRKERCNASDLLGLSRPMEKTPHWYPLSECFLEIGLFHDLQPLSPKKKRRTRNHSVFSKISPDLSGSTRHASVKLLWTSCGVQGGLSLQRAGTEIISLTAQNRRRSATKLRWWRSKKVCEPTKVIVLV